MEEQKSKRRRLSLNDVLAEPFRLFFPAAVLAGFLGVALWPLHFAGMRDFYPGQSHARLMAHGFFGGFILGFLGTAFPRMLGAPRLTWPELLLVFCLYAAMTVAQGTGVNWLGDLFLLLLVIVFVLALLARFFKRTDVPPPGFILVGLAFVCVAVGAALSLLENRGELPFFWMTMKPLLFYQGFVLLPILGVGGFILPRFFGLPSRQNFPESRTPPPGWTKKAFQAGIVGALVIASFVIEAVGWHRLGPFLRLSVTTLYLLDEIPFYRAAQNNALATSLKIAFGVMLAGLLTIVLFPAYRVGLLHLTLVGGFGVITFTVATRVVFGHSGNQARLGGRNRWLTLSVILMLIGMATRVSGEFWPKILISHYNYGALFWEVGALLWSSYVLPKVLIPDPEADK